MQQQPQQTPTHDSASRAFREAPAGRGELPHRSPAPSLQEVPDPILETRRLRYYVDLLAAAEARLREPQSQPECHRGERIALGIDRPELDALPLWTARRPDGKVSIPFIEFVLGEMRRSLGNVARVARDTGVSPVVMVTGCSILDWILERMGSTAAGRRAPRLEDHEIPASLSRLVCGPDSLIAPIARHCEACFAPGPALEH